MDYEATDIWLDMWKGNNPGNQKVSWCNHNFADGPGSACALIAGSCNAQTWNNTSASGTFIKEKILESDDWTSCNNAPKGIVVFENTLFGGKATKLGIGTFTTSQLQTRGISSNTISSIKVLNGYKVELFDGDNFTTPLGIATSNVSDLASIAANDKVSSLKISLANKPAIPTSLVLNPVSDASINLTWSDNANNETNYLVQRSTGVGGLVTIATLPANSKSYTSTQLLDKTVYYYRVVAINNEGFSPSMSKSAQTLVKLQNRTAPGKVEAEDYNWGGQNVAYFDSDLGNKSNKTYRNDDVDIQADTTLSNRYSVGFIVDNEWLNYSIDVQKSGNYKFLLRMSGFGGKVSIKVNGNTVLSNISLISSGGWATWISDSLGVLPLTVGKNELQVFVNKAGFNFDYFELTQIFTENEKVYFYQNTNYSGNSAFLTEGNYTMVQLLAKGLNDNDVSSLKVPSGYTVELYDGDNFTGTKYTLSANEADLVVKGFNDKTSSVKIIKTGTVTGSETAEIKNIEFAIYPNPNHGHFKVILPENVSSKLELYNSLGQMVYQGSHVGNADLQLTDLPKGVYSLKVKSGELNKGLKIVID